MGHYGVARPEFFSIREVNEAIAEKLEELNNRPSKQMSGPLPRSPPIRLSGIQRQKQVL